MPSKRFWSARYPPRAPELVREGQRLVGRRRALSGGVVRPLTWTAGAWIASLKRTTPRRSRECASGSLLSILGRLELRHPGFQTCTTVVIWLPERLSQRERPVCVHRHTKRACVRSLTRRRPGLS